MKLRAASLVLALVLCSPAFGQTSVRQSGTVTPGHAAIWTAPGIIQDGGTAANGFLTSLGVVASGSGICQQSGVITGAYNQICLGVTSSGGGTISINNYNGGTGGLSISVNGVAAGLTTSTLPTVAGVPSCYTNTTGSLADCTTITLPSYTLTGSGSGVTALTSANASSTNYSVVFPAANGTVALVPGSNTQIPFNNSGALGADSGFTYGGNGQVSISNNAGFLKFGASGDVALSRLAAAQLMLSDSTTAGLLTVSQSTDSLTSRTNFGDFTIDTASVANAVVLGTHHGGSDTWSGNIEFAPLGVDQLDYGISNANTWTFIPSIRLGTDGSNRGIVATTIIQEIGGSSSFAFFHQNSDAAAGLVFGATANYGQIGKVSTHIYGLCYSASLSNTIGTCPIEWTDNGAAMITNAAIQIGGVVFANLPTPVAGMAAYITDGKASNCGDSSCTTWGTTVTAGAGALKLQIWYNGTNWTLTGK